jgi:hypothetical protein
MKENLSLSTIKGDEETRGSIPPDLLSFGSHPEPMPATAQNFSILEMSGSHISTFQSIISPHLFANEDTSALPTLTNTKHRITKIYEYFALNFFHM